MLHTFRDNKHIVCDRPILTELLAATSGATNQYVPIEYIRNTIHYEIILNTKLIMFLINTKSILAVSSLTNLRKFS